MTSPTLDQAVLSPATAGRSAGVFLFFGGIVTIVSALVGGSDAGRSAELVVAIVSTLTGAIALVVPWAEWPRSSSLTLVVVALASTASTNYTNPNPYVAGIFFVIIAIWVGIFHERWAPFAIAPVVAVAYWVPLAARPHASTLGASVGVLVVVTVTVGWLLSHLRSSLESAQHRLLEARERRYAAFVERSSEVTLVADVDGKISYASPATMATFGYDSRELESRDATVFTVDRVRNLPDGGLRNPAAFGKLVEVQVRHADGHWVDVEFSAQDHTDNPDIAGVVVHLRDISERKRLERALRQQAFHDDLTGLPTRAVLRGFIQERLDRSEPVAVIFIDLDGFKAVNDTAGHDNGDLLLISVGKRLSGCVESDEMLVRLGGDEFAIATSRPKDDVRRTAQRVLEVTGQTFALGIHRASVSASVGVAQAGPTDDANDVLRNADTAMYVSKSQGRNRVTTFEATMREQLLRRLAIEAEIREALDRGDFAVHYQPIVDLRTGRPVGAEALVRWHHPERGLLAPDEFIHIAEESGLIVPLGRWVLHEACHEAATWSYDRLPLKLAVNVSPRQFQDPGLIDDIKGALQSSGLPPQRLVIEVTESLLIADTHAAAARLLEIAALGVEFALDDFGTGYSSLSYLQQLPFHEIKVDKSFLDHISDDLNDQALVRTIVTLGHELGLIVVAEGVETADQADMIITLGCDQAQGYLYARPAPPDQLDWAALDRGRRPVNLVGSDLP